MNSKLKLILELDASDAQVAIESGALSRLFEKLTKQEGLEVPKEVKADIPESSATQEDAPPAPAPQEVKTKVPTSSKTYTLDELQKAAITLMDKGLSSNDLTGLLAKHGVTSLPELGEERFGAFALDLRQLGADI